METIREQICQNKDCRDFGRVGGGNVIFHASFKTKIGRKQRCRCKTCGKTFSADTGTAYQDLACSRDEFDQVARMRVDGASISAIGRISRRSRTTIVRWLERATAKATRFNEEHLRDYEIYEIQADELCTFVDRKENTVWLFTILEVWSRLWVGNVQGRRSYRNTEKIFNEVIFRGRIRDIVLVTTDGFEFYARVIRKMLGVACVYGQVMKMRRNNRVIRVERHLKMGTKAQLDAALVRSEDSHTLNTSFVERLNLTLPQSLAYLHRRSLSHARCTRRLTEDLALLQWHYNFARPHLSLKFGQLCKTPAMQAGLADRQLSFRDLFAECDSLVRHSILFRLPIKRHIARNQYCSTKMAA